MFSHAKQNRGKFRGIKWICPFLEMSTAQSNLFLGYYYISKVNDDILFEAIVFGFVILETPDLVLKFIT
jgi:hypothetical protein